MPAIAESLLGAAPDPRDGGHRRPSWRRRATTWSASSRCGSRRPGAVVAALGGLFIHDLPDDELARYRDEIEAVTVDAVQKAAQDHIHPDRLAIVAVGDADVVARGSRGGRLRRARGDHRGAARLGDAEARTSRGGGGRMIVVVGLPAYIDAPDGEHAPAGWPSRSPPRPCRRGSAVELVGKVGNDGAGDAVVVALGRLGIGHAALLRDPVRPTPLLVPRTPSRRSDGPAAGDGDAASDAPSRRSRLLPEDPAGRPASRPPTSTWLFEFLPQAAGRGRGRSLSPDCGRWRPRSRARPSPRRDSWSSSPPGATPLPVCRPRRPSWRRRADDDGSFGRLVGAFAGALDAGVDPAAAFRDGGRGRGLGAGSGLADVSRLRRAADAAGRPGFL